MIFSKNRKVLTYLPCLHCQNVLK
uniref:Uncharacterized protein n=1 Tax=Lepeophtheirus salmonis TaxID=72036 RepID=A0A0K2UU94_LEPSM